MRRAAGGNDGNSSGGDGKKPSSSSGVANPGAAFRRVREANTKAQKGWSPTCMIVTAMVTLFMFMVPLLVFLNHEHQAHASAHQTGVQHASTVAMEAASGVVDKIRDVVAPEEELDHDPVIVLSTGNGRWNTGVWPGWGNPRPTLNWAAEGVVVDKSYCPVKCDFTHDQAKLDVADAVIMELVNHPKFLGANTKLPVPWPERRPSLRSTNVELPLVGNFYYEPSSQFPKYTVDPELREHVDFIIGPDRDVAEIPITLICPWGRPMSAYLRPPPPKVPGRLVAYFNEHGVSSTWRPYIQKFVSLLGDDFHAYNHMRNRDLPEEGRMPLTRRLDFIGTYKFALITEPVIQKDWIEPDWSHTLIAGTIPIYIGAPNIIEFTPGPKSFIDIRDYATPELLIERIRQLQHDDDLYKRYFDWKRAGLSPKFQEHVNNCAHYAECRICQHVRASLSEHQKKRRVAAEIASFS